MDDARRSGRCSRATASGPVTYEWAGFDGTSRSPSYVTRIRSVARISAPASAVKVYVPGAEFAEVGGDAAGAARLGGGEEQRGGAGRPFIR